MLEPTTSPIEEQLLAFVRRWFDLLAEGRAAEACGLLDEPNSYGLVWMPAMIGNLVEETFGPGTTFRTENPDGPTFCPSANAHGACHPSIGQFADGSGFWLDHEVPLNGKWSDLTAQFEFKWRDERLSVVLHDLHVL